MGYRGTDLRPTKVLCFTVKKYTCQLLAFFGHVNKIHSWLRGKKYVYFHDINTSGMSLEDKEDSLKFSGF